MLAPNSTYRIQLNDQFTFRNLRAILPYLHDLGISTIYASPITTAAKGSSHGYDVTDPLTLNPEIGTEQELQELAALLKEYKMNWLQDIVPNHMAYDTRNPWLYDVLERGRDSRYHSFFDILTDHPVELLGDKLMAPFLGSTLTESLQKGELTLQFTPTGFVIRYFDAAYPVAIHLYRWICTVSDGYPESLPATLDTLEQSLTADPETWKTQKTRVLKELTADPGWTSFVTTRIDFFNKRINLLQSLLQSQHYILTHAHLASTHINYRRFFTVNSLICLRMEAPEVFAAWHTTIHRWYRQGWINGLRIDHIDGLAAPKKYLQDLRQSFGDDAYIVAEKILTKEEKLPAQWPIQGTTGYDFLAAASQLLTDADGSRELHAFYAEHIIQLPPYDTIVYEQKLDFLHRYMGGELDNLLDLLTSLPLLHAATQDKDRLKKALATWMAAFPTYRGYPDANGGSPDDAQLFRTALTRARDQEPDLVPELNFLDSLTPTIFFNRLMQFTGPLAAKGIEDTTFYIYNPYIAHCEVGDTPGVAGVNAEDFHRQMQYRQQHQRHSLNATTTHDTKRGEDSRIRLSTLSANPQEWIAAVTRWRQLNSTHVIEVNGRPAPSPNDQYLIYQALLGGIPEDGIITDEFRTRFSGYLTKALREAKAETNYDDPDTAYEEQCQAFATALLQHDSPFLEDFIPFAYAIIRRSAPYSLAQLLLKLTAPGIPDIYQGAELWETSFVDPDNRRPVDFTLRAHLLRDLKKAEEAGRDALAQFLHNHQPPGAQKLFTLYRTLDCRNKFPLLFAEGEYIPLPTTGPLLAYLRRQGREYALIAIPLIRYDTPFPSPISVDLPPGIPTRWTSVFTGETVDHPSRTVQWPEGLTGWPVMLLTAYL